MLESRGSAELEGSFLRGFTHSMLPPVNLPRPMASWGLRESANKWTDYQKVSAVFSRRNGRAAASPRFAQRDAISLPHQRRGPGRPVLGPQR